MGLGYILSRQKKESQQVVWGYKTLNPRTCFSFQTLPSTSTKPLLSFVYCLYLSRLLPSFSPSLSLDFCKSDNVSFRHKRRFQGQVGSFSHFILIGSFTVNLVWFPRKWEMESLLIKKKVVLLICLDLKFLMCGLEFI